MSERNRLVELPKRLFIATRLFYIAVVLYYLNSMDTFKYSQTFLEHVEY